MMAPALQEPTANDFWSRLLGVDRVSTDGGEVSLAWKNMPEAWVLFMVIVPAVLLLVWAIYRRERRDVGLGPKALLILLRSALILLVLLMLMGPVLTVETIKDRRNYVIVLVDESRSMKKSDPLLTLEDKLKVGGVTGVTDGDDTIGPSEEAALEKLTRADVVRRVLDNPKLGVLDGIEGKINVAYFTFSGGISAKSSRKELMESYRSESCLGTETAIGDSIRTALHSLRGREVAGVVLFSDGKNNAGMAVREIASQLRQRYLPVYTVAAGIPHISKDMALLELEAREAILANDTLNVSLKMKSFGYEGDEVRVSLWVCPLENKTGPIPSKPQDLEQRITGGKLEAERVVRLEGRNRKQPVTIDYTPRVPGDYLLVFKVDPRPDENTDRNNYLVHRLRVADDKIKVLYVEHLPRYEYRFLKNALIRDTKILAHCLLTSADEGFPQEYTHADDPLFRQPLRAFPSDLKTLLEFDVILFGDEDPERLGPEAARNIESFVTEFGGGLLLISGTHYNPVSLMDTPMARLLPVLPGISRSDPDHIYEQEYGYRLTAEGKKHPITTYRQYRDDAEANLEHWEDHDGRGDGQMRIRWFQPVRKLKAGAMPLVELAGVEGGRAAPPLFVTMHAGRGRIFWSGTDETCLWRKYVGDTPWFYPFWQQAMYWVREGKLLGAHRYRVSVDKERYVLGDPVRIYANAYDERFRLKRDPELEVSIDPPVGDRRLKVRLFKDRSRDGYYEGEFRPTDTGPHTVWAGEREESSPARARFSVYIPDREVDEPILDVAALKELARESGEGRFFTIDEVGELPRVIQTSTRVLRDIREDDLWDSPLVYLVFALLITAEWILRKVFRML